MWNGKHKAIFFEGVDGVGKNELLRSVAKYILLAKPEKRVLLMNFPQYWFFGHDVRLMLRGIVDDILGKQSGIDELVFRSYMYGLDRTLAVMVAESFFVNSNSGSDTIVLSDRGPFSSCVTTGYMWAGGQIKEHDIASNIVPKLFEEADSAMFNFFDGKSILCSVLGEVSESGLGDRKALDNYETESVQMYGSKVYDMAGLTEVVTKQDGKWNNRIDLAKESLRKAGFAEYAAIEIDEKQFLDDSLLLQMYDLKMLDILGPNMFISELKAKSIIGNSLQDDIDKWLYLSLSSGEKYEGNRKENLDVLETKIAKNIKKKVGSYDVSTFRHSTVKTDLKEIFTRYPFMYEVLRRTSGKSMIRFFEKVLENEQLSLF